jgi:hypothetical protein
MMKTAFAICFFLCVAVSYNSEAATVTNSVTIPEISATLGAGTGSGLSASFGPIALTAEDHDSNTALLNNDQSYTSSFPVAYTMGVSGQQMGIKVTLETKCFVGEYLGDMGVKSIEVTFKFQLTVPSALTDPFDTLKNIGIANVKPFEDYVPGSAQFNAEYTLPKYEIEDFLGGLLTGKKYITLSKQVVDPTAKLALLASGTDARITIDLDKAKFYTQGMEIPMKMEIYALKADKMAIDGLSECGENQNSKYICEDSPADCGVTQLYCKACKPLCSAAETAIEAVVGEEYLVDMNVDLLKQIQDTGKALPTPITSSNLIACSNDANSTCFLIGTSAASGLKPFLMIALLTAAVTGLFTQ